MRILVLTNHLKGNDGWSRYSLDFIQELQNLGGEVLVLTSEKSNQNKIREYSILRQPLKYLANPLNSFLTALKIKRIISQFSPDIVHFMVEPYATCLAFLSIKNIKFFITLHGTYSVIPILFENFFRIKISEYLSKKFFEKIDGIVVVSNYTKDHFINYFPKLKSKIRVIPNGVNLREHKIIDLKEKPKNKIKKILLVGKIKKRKGVLEAIEALKYYRDNFSENFVYNIIGSYTKKDGYYQELKRKIKDYFLEDKILFLGKISPNDLQKYYFEADLFLMPSLNIDHNFEGFGLVFLEANTKGVPGIGSKNCGAREAILNGQTGYLVDPYNFKEIAEKIDLILNQKSINPGNCISWARQNDIKIKARELINFYFSKLYA